MKIIKLPPTIFGTLMLAILGPMADVQMTEQAAREQATSTIRSELHLKPDEFLDVRRDEGLERVLASVVARPSWSELIYKVSQTGDEIKEHAVVHHILMDPSERSLRSVQMVM